MAIDSILHIFIGGLIAVFLFSYKVRGIFVLLTLVGLALGKEFFDHFFTLGHCYPVCMDEHVSDFFFSLLFFFLYIPILSFTQKTSNKISYKHYVGIWVILASLQLASREFIDHQQKDEASLLASNVVCTTSVQRTR